MSVPKRPREPYISLDHPYTKEFYTNARLQAHLRRAGLLNKNGEILTQAEYDSFHKDVSIGRQNKRKIDDAILEILNELAREHWAYARDQMENLRKDLLNQFRRIENQYRRRIHPIVIRHKSDGKFQVRAADTTITDNLNLSRRSLDSSSGALPLISKNRSPERPKSAQNVPTAPLAELDNVREELNMIRSKLADVEKKPESEADNVRSQEDIQKIEQSISNIQVKLVHIQEQQKRFDETLEQEKQRVGEQPSPPSFSSLPAKPAEMDQTQFENLIQVSNVIREFNARLSSLETSVKNLPKGLSQEDVDRAIKKNEEKTVSRECVLEALIHGLEEKTKKMQSQLSQPATKVSQSPRPMTQKEVNELIGNEIKNVHKAIEQNHDQSRTSANDLSNKIRSLEMRLNQATKVETPRTTIDALVLGPIDDERSVSRAENTTTTQLSPIEPHRAADLFDFGAVEERLVEIENYLRNTNDRRIEDLQQQLLGNCGRIESLQEKVESLNERKVEQQEISQMIDNTERKLQEEIRKIPSPTIRAAEPTGTTTTTTTSAASAPKNKFSGETPCEQRLNKKITDLRRSFEDNQRDLKRMEKNFHELQAKLAEQATSKPSVERVRVEQAQVMEKTASKELQAIMPFIELLPIFDMFYENEWN